MPWPRRAGAGRASVSRSAWPSLSWDPGNACVSPESAGFRPVAPCPPTRWPLREREARSTQHRRLPGLQSAGGWLQQPLRTRQVLLMWENSAHSLANPLHKINASTQPSFSTTGKAAVLTGELHAPPNSAGARAGRQVPWEPGETAVRPRCVLRPAGTLRAPSGAVTATRPPSPPHFPHARPGSLHPSRLGAEWTLSPQI